MKKRKKKKSWDDEKRERFWVESEFVEWKKESMYPLQKQHKNTISNTYSFFFFMVWICYLKSEISFDFSVQYYLLHSILRLRPHLFLRNFVPFPFTNKSKRKSIENWSERKVNNFNSKPPSHFLIIKIMRNSKRKKKSKTKKCFQMKRIQTDVTKKSLMKRFFWFSEFIYFIFLFFLFFPFLFHSHL